MLALVAILMVIPFLALLGIAVAGVLSAIGIFHEVRDARANAPEVVEPEPVVEPVVTTGLFAIER